MPSGPKKRKAAKKKQQKQSTAYSHSHHGESDGGDLIYPMAQGQNNHQIPITNNVEVEKCEDSLSQNKSVNVGSTQNAGNEKQGNNEIDRGSKSRKSHSSSSSSGSHSSDDESHVIEKKVVDLVQQVNSLLKDIDEDTMIKEKEYLVVEETIVAKESASNDNCSTSDMVKHRAEKSPSREENASSESQHNVEVSTYNGADQVNEPQILQNSDDKQPLVASSTPAVQKTLWKGCCGILDLFSSTDRK